MYIDKSARTRTYVGTLLKLIGAIFRVGDVPPQYRELQKKVLIRELIVIGIILPTSLALEAMSSKFVPARLRENILLQFVPQALAYCFAEYISRRITSFNETMQQTLTASQTPLPTTMFAQPVQQPVTMWKPSVPMTQAAFAAKRLQNPVYPRAFQLTQPVRPFG